MFSIYTSAFNVIRHEFDWRGAITNFCAFARDNGEVVVAVNQSDDDSLEEILAFVACKNVKIVPTFFSYEDPDLDGKIKNAALQNTTLPIKIGVDLDERLVCSQRSTWEKWAQLLLTQDEYQSVFIPSVDLYKSPTLTKGINAKWYVHKSGLFRGTVNFAKNVNGTHDITKSDSCELINADGDLVKTWPLLDLSLSTQKKAELIAEKNIPYVLHYGYADVERRARLNKNFWKKHWKVESGIESSIPTTVEELQFPAVEHGLALE